MVKSEKLSQKSVIDKVAELSLLALKSGSKGQEGEGEAVEMGLEISFWTLETA